jgi:DNA repair protein RadD
LVILPPLWPHQVRAIEEYETLTARGQKRILLQSPTGGGKTRLVAEIARRVLSRGGRVAWYTNRKLLLEQTSGVFDGLSIGHGKRASGHFPERHHDFQVCSIQTEAKRTLKAGGAWTLHEADLAVFDEAHLMNNATSIELMSRHLDSGAVILGATATPVGLGNVYDVLIQAGKNSELRECGSLVMAEHYGPDEPDTRQVGTMKIALGDDLSENQQRKLMGSVGDDGRADVKLTRLFGRVLESYERLNPDRKPAILFAPGVKESRWFAERFAEAGVRAAHIDGEGVWFGGVEHASNREVRDRVIQGTRTGEVELLCNRFVLREGIDAPWIAHGIFACVFGSLQTYLQSGGRIIRAHHTLESVVIQDHGGNWWRHGSLNADRHWRLDDTASRLASEREESFRDPAPGESPKEPFLCPQCQRVLMSRRCPCGFLVNIQEKTRPVVQANGDLIQMKGEVFPKRRRHLREDTEKKWLNTWCRAFQAGMTFRQAEGLFVKEHGYYPVRDLPMMPKERGDWFAKVHFVEPRGLHGPFPPWLDEWRKKKAKK